MKVLFVYLNLETYNLKHFPPGIGVLSAFVKQYGHLTECLYVNDDMQDNSILSVVGNYDPDLIAFSVVTHQWDYVKKYAALIKTKFQAPIICGGAHPTFHPGEVIADPNINFACVGEGEYPLIDILECMKTGGDLSAIPNIWVRNDQGEVFENKPRPLIKNLDTIPFPDRDLLPFQEIVDSCNTEPVIMASRGCPYNCTFCSNSAYKAIYKRIGNWVRQRSPENVIEEIREMNQKYSINTLNFYDECFGYNKNWIKIFCKLYKAEFNFPFGCFIRAETMDRETFHMMADAGLSLIYLGVESGNEEIRYNVMNRKVPDDRIITACMDAKAEGIQVWTYNIVGVPGETVETIEETMELNRKINPHFVSISLFQPMPGTKLYDECIEKKYFSGLTSSKNFYDDFSLNLPTITHKDLIAKFREFQNLSNEIRMAHEKNGEKIFLADI
jgi:radical SAM superfamily enzyme YgiQ (UPF0313 family)